MNDQENQIRENQVSISNLNQENNRLIIKRDETRGEVSTSTNQLNNILSQINSANNDKRSAEEEEKRPHKVFEKSQKVINSRQQRLN